MKDESVYLRHILVRSAWPQVEWKRIAAFRNVLVHDYLGLDSERIWQITQRDIPKLKKTVQLMLEGIA